jgi:hypothetical protein
VVADPAAPRPAHGRSGTQFDGAVPEVGDDPQVPAEDGHIRLERPQLGMRQVAALQLGHPRLGHTHQGGYIALPGVTVCLPDLGETVSTDSSQHLFARVIGTLWIEPSDDLSRLPLIHRE